MRSIKLLAACGALTLGAMLSVPVSAWAGGEEALYQFQTVRDTIPLSGVLLLNGNIYGATDPGGKVRRVGNYLSIDPH